MSDVDSELEQLLPEPDVPLLSLTEFHGGNQLPAYHILKEDHLLKKSFSVAPMLIKIWQDNDVQDLLLRVGQKQLYCNRLRLMCHSQYALREAANGHRELIFSKEQVTWEGLERICQWILQPNALLERRNIIKFLIAAIFLEMTTLVGQIWHCLDLSNQFSEDQAFVISQEALGLRSNLPVTGLDLTMLSHIECFFLTIVASLEFMQLPLDHVCYLLGSDLIAVNCEKEMFYAAVRWLIHDWQNRSKHMLTIMAKIRLSLLPRKFILQLNESPEEEVLRPILESPEFQKIFREVYLEHTFLYYDDNTEIYEHLFELLECSLPPRRPFISDDLCVYHRHYSDPLFGHFSYQQFLTYLGMLQSDHTSWKALKPQKINYKINPSLARVTCETTKNKTL